MGSTFTVNVRPTCSLSNVLSPSGTELCTLVIITDDTNDDITSSFTTYCTIPTSSTISNTSEQTTGEQSENVNSE